LTAAAILGIGLLASGCKQPPDLTQANATSMIEANYAQATPAPIMIMVNDLAMQEGVAAKYWQGVKKYPNGYWGDFKLTDEGKKLVKLPSGGETIAWRPDSPNDPHYAVTMTTVAAGHLKAEGIGSVEDDDNGKVVSFNETEDLSGLPGDLQKIANNADNTLKTRRRANFVLKNGAWALDSVQ
jgi:hypothetical protein